MTSFIWFLELAVENKNGGEVMARSIFRITHLKRSSDSHNMWNMSYHATTQRGSK